jgi:hypothetical protein
MEEKCDWTQARTYEKLRRELAQLMLAELHYHNSSRLIAVFVLVFLAAPDVTLAAELPEVIAAGASAVSQPLPLAARVSVSDTPEASPRKENIK